MEEEVPTALDLVGPGVFSRTPTLTAVWTSPIDDDLNIVMRYTMFVQVAGGEVYSFGSNTVGQLCQGRNPDGETSVTEAGLVSSLLPSWARVRDIVMSPGYVFIQTTNSTVFGCGFNGHMLFNASSAGCGLGICSAPVAQYCTLVPKQFTVQPSGYPNQDVAVVTVSSSRAAIWAVFADGQFGLGYEGKFSVQLNGDGYVNSRRLTALAAFGYSEYNIAGKLEVYPAASVVPSGATEIRFVGRGFPHSLDYNTGVLTPAEKAKFAVQLSQGSCEVTVSSLIAYDFSTKYFVCRMSSAARLSIGSLLNASVTINGENTGWFTIGTVVPDPSVDNSTTAANQITANGERYEAPPSQPPVSLFLTLFSLRFK